MATDANLVSWLGILPQIPKEYKSTEMFDFEYQEDFPLQFNEEPINSEQMLLSKNPKFENPFYLGAYLCFCPGLYPKRLYTAIFANSRLSRTLLFYFYSAVNLEFVSIYEAAYLLLSRIAFPNDLENLRTMFEAASDAYHTANPYCQLSRNEIFRLFIVFILFSTAHLRSGIMSFQEFSDYLSNVQITSNEKQKLYKQLCDNPIPLFLTFRLTCDEPDSSRSGFLKKTGNILSKKKRFYMIDKFKLLAYDASKKNLLEEIPLEGVQAEYIDQASNKRYLSLRLPEGHDVGYKLKNANTNKDASLSMDLCLFSWAEDINYVSFLALLHRLLNE
ncbi:hypothetical protein GPJ56_003179 [Histomonas meleagridis]|uniref:uncharacterized protein n=1 Tax=Histomonas meleagridis TaxID=135588 RepID=UPI00355A1FC3|nr:hypothetical protein GPJ56_003179 [Histomonas meleagridis]KAH0801212.1 hypothetical protein GO595_005807 [Histomonas meleagridis]